MAAEIANKTLDGVILNCKAGKDVMDICMFGDKVIQLQTDKVYKAKKSMKKGIAFPTCISVNECVCHFSPLNKSESIVLKDGDIVKIDLGVHIDGFIAVVAHSLIVGLNEKDDAKPIEGPLADAIVAAKHAVEAAHKLIRPGNKNSDLTKAFKNISEIYGVSMCEGTLCHEMKQFVIDGNKVVILKESHDQKVNDITFEKGEVYAVDICVSTGEGKLKEMDSRTTVYKRVVDASYRLKRQSSRFVLNEVNKTFPTMPFTLRALSDATKARAGVIECVKNDLLQPYHVLYEREGSHVLHFKFTVLVRESGTVRITGTSTSSKFFDSVDVRCEKEVNDELKKVLALSTNRKKKRRGRRKKKKPADDAASKA